MSEQSAKSVTQAVRRLYLVGLSVIGVLGIVLALNAALSNQFVGAGVCLAASALALGFLKHDG